MNNEIHQVYSYMLHRAVGVCSAIKHEQFQATTEMTVNRLAESAQSQLKAINEALKNQKQISEMGVENIKTFKENDQMIKEAQITSIDKLKYTGNLIEDNLINLQLELDLHQKSGEKLIKIEKSADEISIKLDQHKIELHQGHEQLLKDVDEISDNLKRSNLELLDQYSQTLEFLDQFKSIMFVLSKMASGMKTHVDKVLQSLHEIGFELTPEFVLLMMLNVLHFVSGMVFMLFIGVHGSCKLILMALFFFNSIVSYTRAEISVLGVNFLVWMAFLSEFV